MRQHKWFIPGIIVGVALLFAMIFGGVYNGLVSSRESVTKSFSDLGAAYQRRADLIPQLVESVKGAGYYEKTTLESVMAARAKATSVTIDPSKATPEQVQAYQDAQAGAGSALGRLIAVAENYPQLKATDAYRDFMAQLESTENRINQARRDYNDTARPYNTKIQSFPTNMIAGMFGFSKYAYFEASEGANKAPKVEFKTGQ